MMRAHLWWLTPRYLVRDWELPMPLVPRAGDGESLLDRTSSEGERRDTPALPLLDLDTALDTALDADATALDFRRGARAPVVARGLPPGGLLP